MWDMLNKGIEIRKYVLAQMMEKECQNGPLCPIRGIGCPMDFIYPDGYVCSKITSSDWEKVFGTKGDEFLRITLNDYDRKNLSGNMNVQDIGEKPNGGVAESVYLFGEKADLEALY